MKKYILSIAFAMFILNTNSSFATQSFDLDRSIYTLAAVIDNNEISYKKS
jgi:hypothetical protein